VDGLGHLMTLRTSRDAIDQPQRSKKELVIKPGSNKMVHRKMPDRNTMGRGNYLPSGIKLANAD
jgi:hypothetical protein